jgi:hypothetical protein
MSPVSKPSLSVSGRAPAGQRHAPSASSDLERPSRLHFDAAALLEQLAETSRPSFTAADASLGGC